MLIFQRGLSNDTVVAYKEFEAQVWIGKDAEKSRILLDQEVASEDGASPGKGMKMLISQSSKSDDKQGSLAMSFAELRQELAAGEGITESARQRLRSLTRRLAKVQALGDEFNRVTLSDCASRAVDDQKDCDTENSQKVHLAASRASEELNV